MQILNLFSQKKFLKKIFKKSNSKKVIQKNIFQNIFLNFLFFFSQKNFAQTSDRSREAMHRDSIEKFSLHYQATVIGQYKPTFNAPYSGENSLKPETESQYSFTTTLFAGVRIGKYGALFINPEGASGAGLSGALGIGASTNGETYRVGNPALTFSLARLFYSQIFPLKAAGSQKSAISDKKKEFDSVKLISDSSYQSPDINQLGGYLPEKYFKVTLGKISVSDFFDKNDFSHDPRTQFMSWGLMSNGAWDYPADVRGYTPSLVLEYFSPKWEYRYALSLEPLTANSSEINYNIGEARAHTIEVANHFSLGEKKGTLRLLGFLNTANMGSYTEALRQKSYLPDVISTRQIGRTKYGLGLSADMKYNDWIGMFGRLSWNDGNNETWAFTEIDQSISAGLSFDGKKWHREHDNVGVALVASVLSDIHKKYIAAGGKGFVLGDGKLNYGIETLAEIFYTLNVWQEKLKLTSVYQFIVNPGYNQDRGPVSVFSLRLHLGL